MARPDRFRSNGRVLFLTEDSELLRRQLAGETVPLETLLSAKLIDNISTDEITPGWVCFHYDETLGEYSLVGLRGGLFDRSTLKSGRFDVIVSGESKGCGSSREQAPYSELAAGVKLVIARSIEKIYGQNCQNIGLLTSTDFSLIPRLVRGEEIAIDEFTSGLDPISADIVRAGGLFEYNKLRMAGERTPPAITTATRPMTMVEKIIAAHAVVDAKTGTLGVPAVKPGDALFVRTDVRFSHEYVTPMADALFVAALGKDAKVAERESVFTFRDHLTFLGDVMDEKKKSMGLLDRASGLADTQERFAKKHALKLYGEVPAGGSEAICHNAVIEDIALPGQIVTGTDSHTCMAGALGCFAFGVGSTDMANAWYTRDVRVKVPETVRFVLRGTLRPGVSAKDVMLHILAQPFFRTSRGIGKVLEFAGEGLQALPMDEQATLTNMAVEAGGFTGILEPGEVVVDYLASMRGLSKDAIRARIVTSDPGAEYLDTFDIDLADVPVMVATPGDPRNGVPMQQLEGDVAIDIAYGGSCTGGKKVDMDMYALVLRKALERGQKIASGVHCYIQFGSQHIRRYAEQQGYVDVFREVGVELINPSCGACINAGPGASAAKEQVTVSAINRNFPGRSGPGKVYLASPLTVAASAVAGRIVDPIAFLEG
ncbi:aconitase family protein [Sandaracinus amylolyticus]|uniref:aconitase family protein n=1 Tax=Sandaracinus amylolyticus TaxID=927083 RepID=UPI001F32AF5F|nr:aconitase family protein [Sandaracinus amylolyticus]UJR79598.1 3-isopropylmalate dehydratase large subunit [Sandaracinus amylolyticus]